MPLKKRLKLGKLDKNQSVLTSVFQQTESSKETISEEPTASSTESVEIATQPSTSTEKQKVPVERHFQPSWEQQFPWLKYDNGAMFCTICLDGKVAKNSFTAGCKNFRKSAITDHALTADHQLALKVPQHQQNQQVCEEIVMTKQERGIATTVRTVHFLVHEDLPLIKFGPTLELLRESGAPDLEFTKVSDKVNYDSRRTADEMLECMAEHVTDEAKAELKSSPFVAVMADETTDITVTKRLGVYVRTVNANMEPKTRFLANIGLPDGCGNTVCDAILGVLREHGVPPEKVISLGSDGAKVMTGNKNGVTGLMRRHNPHMINIHCVAHRLQLCTSQAADDVPALKDYQEVLTSLFHYFQSSAVRTAALASIQEVLDHPTLKFKVYSIRWLSFYQALDTVQRTLDPLLTYLTDKNKVQDAKAIGLRKKIATEKFIGLTHVLSDVIPIVSALNLFLQGKDIDISLIQIKIKNCIEDIQRLKEGKGQHQQLFLQQVQKEDGETTYLGHHITGCRASDIQGCVNKFIDNLVENMEARFSQTEIISSFGVLSMRPLSFLNDAELKTWGCEQIQSILRHFGKEAKAEWTEDGDKVSKVSTPLVDSEETLKEWLEVKQHVKAGLYPKDNTATLWQLIAKFQGAQLPNMMKLATICLLLPVQTADVERGFSAQNTILTPKRNRLAADMFTPRISIE